MRGGVFDDLFVGFVGQVGSPHNESVTPADLVIGDKILEIPGGISFFAAPGGRLGEADMILPTETVNQGHIVTDPEIPGLIVLIAGEIEHQNQAKIGIVYEGTLIVGGQVSG